jgi:AraC-like DNA-binding protein
MSLATEDRVRAEGPSQDRTDDIRITVWLRALNPREISVRTLQRSHVSITEREDGFALGVQLRDYPSHVLCVEAVETKVPFHSLQFLLSRRFLDELAGDLEAPPIREIAAPNGVAVRDPVLAAAATSMLPFLAMPDVDELVAGHIMLAFGTYVCAKYGELRTPRTTVGGLSNWQKRVASDVIEARLGTGVALPFIASMCGLRVSHFSHAFKRTFGMAPYQWLQFRRVEKAKELLRSSGHASPTLRLPAALQIKVTSIAFSGALLEQAPLSGYPTSSGQLSGGALSSRSGMLFHPRSVLL